MTPTQKAVWIGALRSGRYHQGFDRFRYHDEQGQLRWCALGVLIDCCPELYAWCFMRPERFEPYLRLNDDLRWSFAQIAAYIEQHA